MKWIAKRKWNYPIAYERAYAKELLAYVNSIFRVYKAHSELLEDFISTNDIKLDSDDFSQDFIDNIGKDIPSFDNMQVIASKYFDLINDYNRGEFEKVLSSVGLNAVGEERWYKEYSAHWINDNLDLIKSIHTDTLNNIKRELRESVSSTMTSGARTKYLASRVEKLANTTRNRAALIARDQVGKLNGRVTEYRQRGAGIREYKWSTSHDSRVRDEHAERDGNIFRWDKPPYDGHPGTPIRCRCVALPVIDFKNLKGQYYTPRSNRQAVAVATQQYGNPNGAIYYEIIPPNASVVVEEGKPFANNIEAQKYFEEYYNMPTKGNTKSVSEVYTDTLNQWRKLDERFKILKDFNCSDFGITVISKKRSAEIMACSTGNYYKKLGLEINIAKAADKKALIQNKKEAISSKWSTLVDEDKINVATATHEFGHALHNHWLQKHINEAEYREKLIELIKTSRSRSMTTHRKNVKKLNYEYFDKPLIDVVDKWCKNVATKENITIREAKQKYQSRYGMTNHKEFFAETFAHAILSSNPNPFGREMLNWLKGEGYDN